MTEEINALGAMAEAVQAAQNLEALSIGPKTLDSVKTDSVRYCVVEQDANELHVQIDDFGAYSSGGNVTGAEETSHRICKKIADKLPSVMVAVEYIPEVESFCADLRKDNIIEHQEYLLKQLREALQ